MANLHNSYIEPDREYDKDLVADEEYIETLPEEENHFLEEIDETLIFLKNNYD